MVLENVVKALHLLVQSIFYALGSESYLASLNFKVVSVSQPQLALLILLEVDVTLGKLNSIDFQFANYKMTCIFDLFLNFVINISFLNA